MTTPCGHNPGFERRAPRGQARAFAEELAIIDFHKLWIEQCEGARHIKDEFGTGKALGYLIGEKLVDFVRESDRHPKFIAELPNFVAEIERIFEPQEIRRDLENLRRTGSFGHIGTDAEVEFMRGTGMIEDNPVRAAEDILIVERIKEVLLR